MTEDTSNHVPSKENSQRPLTGDEAIEAVNQAMAILPKRRLECLRRLTKFVAIMAMLLAVFVYWNLLRSPRLKISKETTYITEPLTPDGMRVDYFTAFEQEFYPPEMKTDDNGYRLIVRALGDVADYQLHGRQGNRVAYDAEAASAQVYEKLGLDPAIQPTLKHSAPIHTVLAYFENQASEGQTVGEIEGRIDEPWKLDDLPMLESWLEENGPALDLLGEAVRKPAFFMPLIRKSPEAPISESLVVGQIQRVRAFARSLTARANYRIGTGDIDGAIDDAVTLKRLGRHVQQQGTMVELLVGIAVESIADAIGIAGNRESQPTKKQLRRFVDELAAVPPPVEMERKWLADRYYTLDSLQAMARDRELLAEHLSIWDDDEDYSPGITISLPLDWNVIMRRMNAAYDNMGNVNAVLPSQRRSPGDIFLGVRSRHVAEYLTCVSLSSNSAFLEARRRTNCSNNLRRITLALLLYEREHGTLPPAYTVDAEGKPLHSWRVLLLPYVGETGLFARIRLDEPWDSEHNRQFHDAAVDVYQCPSANLKQGETAYSVIVGERTAFQPGEGRLLDDFGTHLILVVGRWNPVCWMDPASELTKAIASEGVKQRPKDRDGIGCEHPGLALAALRDGSTRFIPMTLEPPVLQSLLDGTADEWPQ
jgi:hypothetical protein